MANMYRWVVLLAFFFPMGSLAAFIVDDFTKPALTCEPFLLLWQGGIAPWTLRVLQASDSAILENLGTFKVTSFNWNVDLAAGTSVQIQLQDSTGATAISEALTIQPGSTDCTLSTVGAQQTSTTQRTTVITSTTRATPPAQTTSTRALTTSSTTLTTSSTPTTSSTLRASSTASSSARAVSAPSSSSATASRSNDQQSSSSLVLLPASTSAVTGVGDASESGTGAYSTAAPEALSTLKTSAPTGMILGILIPGLLLLAFFCVFIFRRRRKSSPDIEQLSATERNNTPAWFMRPAYHSDSARVSYGIQSSGSYRTETPETLLR